MSLYNTLNGMNPITPALLDILSLDGIKYNIPRFRDIYLNEDGTMITVLARIGGGNREAYGKAIENLKNNHPNYLKDYDDEYDPTYALIEFSVPEVHAERCKQLATGTKHPSLQESFEFAMQQMEKMSLDDLKADPRFAPIVKVVEDLKKHMDALEDDGGRGLEQRGK